MYIGHARDLNVDFPFGALNLNARDSRSTSTQRQIAPSPNSTRRRPYKSSEMAALIKAANAKIRSNPVTDYVCSTRTSFEYPAMFFA